MKFIRLDFSLFVIGFYRFQRVKDKKKKLCQKHQSISFENIKKTHTFIFELKEINNLVQILPHTKAIIQKILSITIQRVKQ